GRHARPQPRARGGLQRRGARIPALGAAVRRLDPAQGGPLGVDSRSCMTQTGAARAWPKLREVFSKEKAARGFDIQLAVKASRGGWLLGALVGFGIQPFYPPTARIGAAGWGVIVLLSIAAGVWIHTLMRRPERVTRDTL